MALIDTNGQVHLIDSDGKVVEVARIEFSEYYNTQDGTTPAITVLEIKNPVQFVTDTFYLLSDEDSEKVLFNSIKTNETTMPLMELYVNLMSRDKITFEATKLGLVIRNEELRCIVVFY
jgi:hypothetical protein